MFESTQMSYISPGMIVVDMLRKDPSPPSSYTSSVPPDAAMVMTDVFD
jgi:hypothetical protein